MCNYDFFYLHLVLQNIFACHLWKALCLNVCVCGYVCVCVCVLCINPEGSIWLQLLWLRRAVAMVNNSPSIRWNTTLLCACASTPPLMHTSFYGAYKRNTYTHTHKMTVSLAQVKRQIRKKQEERVRESIKRTKVKGHSHIDTCWVIVNCFVQPVNLLKLLYWCCLIKWLIQEY